MATLTDYMGAADCIREAISDMKRLPPSRDVALAITNAEQSLMWLQRAMPDTED